VVVRSRINWPVGKFMLTRTERDYSRLCFFWGFANDRRVCSRLIQRHLSEVAAPPRIATNS
jgi:hypothetical protein